MNPNLLDDLVSIREVAPEMADLILEVCKLNVEEMHKSIFSERNENHELMKTIDEAKRAEMIEFYNSMQSALVEHELYEYCDKLLDCLDYLENFSADKVVAD